MTIIAPSVLGADLMRLGKEIELPVDEDLYVAELNKRIEAEGKFPTIK